jgi:hypothetical protein
MQIMRDAVVETVKDAERRDKLLALTRSLEITLSDYNQAYAACFTGGVQADQPPLAYS